MRVFLISRMLLIALRMETDEQKAHRLPFGVQAAHCFVFYHRTHSGIAVFYLYRGVQRFGVVYIPFKVVNGQL